MEETKREKTAVCRRFSPIFADLVLDLQGKWSGAAEPQETPANRRKSQEAGLTPFSHLVSPMKRCPTLGLKFLSENVNFQSGHSPRPFFCVEI